MTRLPLQCCTSIIRSSALMQASSSLSMGRSCTWPTEATRHRNAFPPFSRKHFRVWIPNLGAFSTIASVSLTHILCLFACFHEFVSCMYAFFSTCLSTCVAGAACFVFCFIFTTNFLFSFFFLYKVNRHLCHGAYWCTRSIAHMPVLLFLLHFLLSNSCMCVCQLVSTRPSSPTFTWSSSYNYRHIHMYICNDYCEITTHNMNFPITICLSVPADRGFARCLHICDPMFRGLYSNIHTCLCLLWIHTYHVHKKKNLFCMHHPFPSTPPLSVSISSTWTRAHVCMFTPSLFNPNTKKYV